MRTAAIRYHPSGFKFERERPMGLHAANVGFLGGFAASISEGERVYCYARSAADADDFAARLGELGAPRGTPVEHIALTAVEQLAKPGCLYVPAPVLGSSAWHRRHVGNRQYSLCGVTHTMSSARAMDAVIDYLVAPVQRWDALVCTSTAIKSMVERMLEQMADYLLARVGARPVMPVGLPVIPLGVDSRVYAAAVEGVSRQGYRAQHGIADNDVVILFLGRLSAHSKAHPSPMFLALERAQRASGKNIVLLLVGWFHNDATRDGFAAAAGTLMPSVRVLTLDGKDAAVRAGAWRAADIFVSLVDNIQESFGLTPLEAMASGLPCVVSDWDGYRDNVVDGETGFLIPTVMPPPGAGQDLAIAHALEVENHDVYVARSSQAISVDIEAAAAAIARLAGDEAMRIRMGAGGRRRAAEHYDWRIVISQYRQLWAELAELRRSADEMAPRTAAQAPWPAREDPFALFAGFGSGRIEPGCRILAADRSPLGAFERLTRVPLSVIDGSLLVDAEAVMRQLEGAPRGLAIEGDGSRHEARERGPMLRAMAWLAKLGLVKIVR